MTFVLTLHLWVCQASSLEAGKLPPGKWRVWAGPHSVRLSPSEDIHIQRTKSAFLLSFFSCQEHNSVKSTEHKY